MSHTLTGFCPKCQNIFDRYPGFHPGLRTWFEKLQAENPDAHISCAGRGSEDQELFFERGASNAHWTQSAHNWNMAIDIFQLKDNQAFWPVAWFQAVVKPKLTDDLTWYGTPSAKFKELPHVEVSNWHELALNGEAKLVE